MTETSQQTTGWWVCQDEQCRAFQRCLAAPFPCSAVAAVESPTVQSGVAEVEVAARRVVDWVAGLKGAALVAVVAVAVYGVFRLVF